MQNVIALSVATLLLVLIPGPNAALIVANSLRHGFRLGMATVLGTTAGIALQLLLVIVGVAALVDLAAAALEWVRWLGVAYLLYLGIRSFNEPAADLGDIRAQQPSQWRVLRHGLMLALVNPKTLLFNAAFLPQFLAVDGDVSSQMMLLSAVFLGVILVGDSLWVLFASGARQWLRRYGSLRNKLTGGFLCGAGLVLALSRCTA